jgi:hypothetical protein
MFAQDGLTDSAWGDRALHTASLGVHSIMSLWCRRPSALGSRRLIRSWQRREFQAPSPARAYTHFALACWRRRAPSRLRSLAGFGLRVPICRFARLRPPADGNAENFKRRRQTEPTHTFALACWRRGDTPRLRSLANFRASVPICQCSRPRPCVHSRTSLGCRRIGRWQREELQAPSPGRAQARAL